MSGTRAIKSHPGIYLYLLRKTGERRYAAVATYQGRGELLDKVWDYEGYAPADRLLRVWVSRLRRHLPGLPLVTVHGEGYRLDLPTGVVPQ